MSDFDKDNKSSLKFVSDINKRWIGLGDFFLVPFINMHTLYINSSKQKNSNLILLPRGSGKSDFLGEVASQNKKYVNVLPAKIYESELVARGEEYFNKKILIHYDYIIAMFGLSTKQRQQLTGFFTSLLSDSRYSRDRYNLENIKCLSMFGMAKDSFNLHKEDLFESTFLDRLTMLHKTVSKEEKQKILEFRSEKHNFNVPLKLKWKKTEVNIKLDMKEFSKRINEWAMELDLFDVMSYTRAQDYICNWLKANAYYNNRKDVCSSDLGLYFKIHPLHIDNAEVSRMKRLVHLLEENRNMTYDEIMKKTGWAKGTVAKYIKRVRSR